jgi:hypothetical protein
LLAGHPFLQVAVDTFDFTIPDPVLQAFPKLPPTAKLAIRCLMPAKSMVGKTNVAVTRSAMDDEPTDNLRITRKRKTGKASIRKDLVDFLSLIGTAAALEDFRSLREQPDKETSSTGARARNFEGHVAHLLK